MLIVFENDRFLFRFPIVFKNNNFIFGKNDPLVFENNCFSYNNQQSFFLIRLFKKNYLFWKKLLFLNFFFFDKYINDRQWRFCVYTIQTQTSQTSPQISNHHLIKNISTDCRKTIKSLKISNLDWKLWMKFQIRFYNSEAETVRMKKLQYYLNFKLI